MIFRTNLCLVSVAAAYVCLTACGPADKKAPIKKEKAASFKKDTSNEDKFEAKLDGHIAKKEDLNTIKDRDIPLLIWAVEFNYVDSVEKLLKNGADPNTKPLERSRETALFSTVSSLTYGNDALEADKVKRSRAIAELLITHGADVTYEASSLKTTPLHQAALRGRTDLCRIFVKHGANVRAVTFLGTTPLHNAVKAGYWETAGYLLSKGADVNLKDKLGKTPLALAKERGDEDLNKKIRKETRLDYNPGSDYDRTIKVLVAKGAK